MLERVACGSHRTSSNILFCVLHNYLYYCSQEVFYCTKVVPRIPLQFKSWIALSNGWITIQWISVRKPNFVIQWIVIYPVLSVMFLWTTGASSYSSVCVEFLWNCGFAVDSTFWVRLSRKKQCRSILICKLTYGDFRCNSTSRITELRRGTQRRFPPKFIENTF